MFEIKQAIGPNRPNQLRDVIVVRLLLNRWIAANRLSTFKSLLNETDPADKSLFEAISVFQREVAKAASPGNVLEPGSRMFKWLANPNTGLGPYFPLSKVPTQPWTGAKRFFGAGRPTEATTPVRAHAGCDLICKRFDIVYAVAGGTVVSVEPNFFQKKKKRLDAAGKPVLEKGKQVWDLVFTAPVVNIDHGTYVVRYGEIEEGSCVVKKGDKVLPGEFIAKISRTEMLHFELYDRSLGATGGFRVEGTASLYWNKKPKPTHYISTKAADLLPFYRRHDLQNPDAFLEEVPGQSA